MNSNNRSRSISLELSGRRHHHKCLTFYNDNDKGATKLYACSALEHILQPENCKAFCCRWAQRNKWRKAVSIHKLPFDIVFLLQATKVDTLYVTLRAASLSKLGSDLFLSILHHSSFTACHLLLLFRRQTSLLK